MTVCCVYLVACCNKKKKTTSSLSSLQKLTPMGRGGFIPHLYITRKVGNLKKSLENQKSKFLCVGHKPEKFLTIPL